MKDIITFQGKPKMFKWNNKRMKSYNKNILLSHGIILFKLKTQGNRFIRIVLNVHSKCSEWYA